MEEIRTELHERLQRMQTMIEGLILVVNDGEGKNVVRGGNQIPAPVRLGNQNPLLAHHPHESDDEFDDGDMAMVRGNQPGHRQNNYRVPADIPSFHGNLSMEDCLDWITEVKRAFDVMETMPDRMVKLVAYKLKSGALFGGINSSDLVNDKERVRYSNGDG